MLITDEVSRSATSPSKKCIAWLRAIRRGGTLLLCAHSMFHVRRSAPRRSDPPRARAHARRELRRDARIPHLHEEKRGKAAAHRASPKGVSQDHRRVDRGRPRRALRHVRAGRDPGAAGSAFEPDDQPPVVLFASCAPTAARSTDRTRTRRLPAHAAGSAALRLAVQSTGCSSYTANIYFASTRSIPTVRLFDTVEVEFMVRGETRLRLVALQHRGGRAAAGRSKRGGGAAMSEHECSRPRAAPAGDSRVRSRPTRPARRQTGAARRLAPEGGCRAPVGTAGRAQASARRADRAGERSPFLLLEGGVLHDRGDLARRGRFARVAAALPKWSVGHLELGASASTRAIPPPPARLPGGRMPSAQRPRLEQRRHRAAGDGAPR